MDIKLRKLQKDDIPLLKDLPPKEWNLNIVGIFNFFLGNPFFHCILAIDSKNIAGVSACYIYRGTAWLGQIIVREDYRKQGIGYIVTDEIIRYCKQRGSRSILLTATPLGKILYTKLGFREITQYIFYRRDSLMDKPECSLLEKFFPGDFEAVCNMDLKVTGEDRRDILKAICTEGIVYRDSGILKGFYFDHFRNGAVVASNNEAGLALLQYKHSTIKAVSVCPEENEEASSFFIRHGFTETARGLRMISGDDIVWKPDYIYSRMAAYLG